MLTMHSLLTRIFSFTALTQQKSNSANVRTERFRLQSVHDPTGHSVLLHQHTTRPCRLMQDLGCKIVLGTDNVMFVPPDMLSEMAFTSAVYRIDPQILLRAAIQGSELTGTSFFIRTGVRANLFTIDPAQSSLHFSRDPVTSIIKRASFCQIGHNVFNL